jgi:hypothetical protein
MGHRLDLVAIWLAHEGTVVMGIVFRTQSGRAIIDATML